MKTLVTIEVVQSMVVLVESDDTADEYIIADTVADAYGDGWLYDDLEEDSYESTVLDVLKSDATEARKVAFEKEVSAYVHPKNKFTLDELLGV
jgi:hypothetical protein